MLFEIDYGKEREEVMVSQKNEEKISSLKLELSNAIATNAITQRSSKSSAMLLLSTKNSHLN